MIWIDLFKVLIEIAIAKKVIFLKLKAAMLVVEVPMAPRKKRKNQKRRRRRRKRAEMKINFEQKISRLYHCYASENLPFFMLSVRCSN